MPLRVAFLAAECEPWAKTGGLADVVDALARALGRLSGRPVGTVDVYLPRYREVRVPAAADRHDLRLPDPHAPTGATDVAIVDVAADGYRLRLVDHAAAFDRAGIYGDEHGDYGDNAWRFGLFCRAALEAIRRDPEPVDVLHLHDWHATPASILRAGPYADDPAIGTAAVVHTLHNLAYHGWTPREQLPQLGLAPGDGIVPAEVERFDLLRTGIELADLVTTVSERFAQEALTPEFGRGLEGSLLALGDRFSGILNGLDPVVWDPLHDPALAAPYGARDRTGKLACRRDLLGAIGFEPDDDGAVLGMIGRLDPQKGFDLLAAAAPELLARGARIVVMGTGQAALADSFRALAAADPRRVALIERFDRAVARRVYAGIDLFVMPSRFEPCGQGQMIALRYGTPPIVRRVGGLAESVIDVGERPDAGTGFVFDDARPEALVEACLRAIACRTAGGAGWEALLDRAMAADFDWERGAAPRYVETYRRAVAIRARRTGAAPD
ncbi:MAG TPA: glycogen/starch synthase [Clostridia bacterium]|nr:glycogen/starch synthase [Clostridia bacterium]